MEYVASQRAGGFRHEFFAADSPFPNDRAATADNDFGLRATANLVVPEDGVYHLGLQGDERA